MTDENPRPKRSDFTTEKIPAKEAFNPNGIVHARSTDPKEISAPTSHNPDGILNGRNKKK